MGVGLEHKRGRGLTAGWSLSKEPEQQRKQSSTTTTDAALPLEDCVSGRLLAPVPRTLHRLRA